jgi:UPF0716 protein FxsA
MVEGVLILAGGIMLITPGFLTDLLGFSLILPFSRKWFGDMLIGYFRGKKKTGHRRERNSGDPFDRSGEPGNGEDVDHPEIKP